MTFAPRFTNIFNKISNIFQPKLHVAGLGRWGSTISKEKKNVSWFHDMCNYDNCYTNMFSIIRFKNSNPSKPSPESPKPHSPVSESTIPETNNNTIPVLPVHYALEMPRKLSSM